MNLLPLQDFVLLKELLPEEKTESGIILPEDVDKERNQGEIVAKGETTKLPLKVGDKVLFQSYGFNEIEIDFGKFLIGKEENIIGKLYDDGL